MSELLGSLELEFLINNPEILQELRKAEANFQSSSKNIQQSADKASKAFNEALGKNGAAVGAMFDKSTERLKINLAQMQQLADLTQSRTQLVAYNREIEKTADEINKLRNAGKKGFDELGNAIIKDKGLVEALNTRLDELRVKLSQAKTIKEVSSYNNQIEKTQTELTKLGKAGKAGFDELGNAVKKSSNYFEKSYSVVRQLAYAIPGLGFSGIIAAIGLGLVTLAEKTGLFNEKLTLLKQTLRDTIALQNSLNSVRVEGAKSAEAESVKLDALYKASQNHNLAITERIQAAVELQNLYPTIFGNMTTEAILAGQGAAAYRDLKESILEVAYASAISGRIGQNQIRRLSDDLEITKEQTEQLRLQKIEQENLRKYRAGQGALGEGGNDDYKYKALAARQAIEKSQKKENDLIKDRSILDKENLALETRRDNLIKKRGIKVITGGVNSASDQDKAAMEGQKIALQADIETQNQISDNRKKALSVRAEALKKALADEKQIVDINQAQQLANAKLSNQDRKNIVDRSNQEKLKLETDYQKKISALQTAAIPNEKESDAARQAAINARISALDKIAAIEREYSRQKLDTDEAKVQAITDRFMALKADIDAANREIDKQNKKIKDPKKRVQRVDGSGLYDDYNTAIGNQVEDNITEKLSKAIEDRKRLYDEYENYRQQLGAAAAQKEFSTLLESGANFEEYVKRLKDMYPTDGASPAVVEKRAELFKKMGLEIEKDQSQINLRILVQAMDFNQKINQISEEGIAIATRLRKEGRIKEVAIITAQYAAQLDAEVIHQRETIFSYKSLYDQLSTMGKEQADLYIAQAKNKAQADLANKQISEATYTRLIELIKQAEAAVKSNTMLNALGELGSALENIGNAAAGLDEGFASAISSISQTIKLVAQLGKDIGSLQNKLKNYEKDKADAGGGFAGTVSAISGIIPIVGSVIGGIVKGVGAVVGFLKGPAESARKAAAEMQNYQNQLVQGEVKYNELMRERARTIKDINDLTVKQLQLQEASLAKQGQSAQKDFDRLLGLIQGQGQQVTGQHTEKHGGILGAFKKTKVVQDLAGLGGADYDNLEKLYAQGKLTDATKQWFEQLKAVKEEMGDIGDAVQQVKDQLSAIFTGTTANSLEQAILNGLKAGKRGFAGFADDFKGNMQDALASIFNETYLKDKAKAYYDKFSELAQSGGGLDKAEAKQLQDLYANMIGAASKEFDKLYTAAGVAKPGSGNNGNTLEGSIGASLTEDTGSVIAGRLTGIQLALITIKDNSLSLGETAQQQLAEIRKQTLLQMQISANTKRTAENTDVLPDMKESLKSIDKNTKDTSGNILRAAGII